MCGYAHCDATLNLLPNVCVDMLTVTRRLTFCPMHVWICSLCVRSLIPLFPGANELDQLSKIHDVIGTPTQQCMAKLQKVAGRSKYNFDYKKGSGIARLVPHASKDCLELLTGMLMYDADDRYSAHQCLRHPYFKDLRDAEKRSRKGVLTTSARRVAKVPAKPAQTLPKNPAAPKLTLPQPAAKPLADKKKPQKPYKNKKQQASSLSLLQANAQKKQNAAQYASNKGYAIRSHTSVWSAVPLLPLPLKE